MSERTIVFFPEGAFGPTNNCVGIGEVLRERGHRVVFVVEESFAGTLESRGFEERLIRLAPPPETPEEPGQFWKDFIRETAPVFRQSTFEQLGDFMAPTWQALIDGARYVDERLVEIFDWLNLYLYPRELDYPRSRPLEPTWHNLESSVRTSDEPWTPAARIAEGDGALIYLSLGSLGSGDVALMERLVSSLGRTRHRYVVSQG